MKKIIYSFLAAATLMSCATSDASNNKVDNDMNITKNLTVKGSFNTIRSCSNIDIEYTPSSSVSISATSTSYGLDALNVYVKNNTLYLETQNDKSTWSKKGYVIKVKLSAPTVSTYNTSGNSQIKVKGYIAVQGDLTVTTSGNSEVEFKQKVDCETIRGTSTGNSSIEFDGNAVCSFFNTTSSGNSGISVEELLCDKVQIRTSGNSSMDMELNATSLSAQSSGNSEIKVSGKVDSYSVASSGNSGINIKKLQARNTSVSSSGNSSISR